MIDKLLKLLGLRKKEPVFDAKYFFKTAKDLYSRYDKLLYAMSEYSKTTRLPPEVEAFAVKAEFAIFSLKDELLLWASKDETNKYSSTIANMLRKEAKNDKK